MANDELATAKEQLADNLAVVDRFVEILLSEYFRVVFFNLTRCVD